MEIGKVCLVTFSPTHTSYRIGEAIVRGLKGESVSCVDLTLHGVGQVSFSEDTVVVITVPVYGGHVAPLALKRMEMLESVGAPAVIAVVYGNRAYEHALQELDAFVSARGFKIIAGGTFIGEHSYSSSAYPIAQGRPDDADLQYAETFGEKIRTKIAMAADKDKLYGVDVRRILRPRQPFFPLLRFLRKVMKLRKQGRLMPRVPEVDINKCTHCGYCARHCPNGAIAEGDECHTLSERCIRCCACVKGCPQHARTFDTPFAPLLSECFPRQKENRIIL